MAEDTMSINFFGNLNLFNEIFPLIRSNGRVVNVSSRYGLLGQVCNKDAKKIIKNEKLKIEDLVELVEDYIQ